MRTLYMEFGGPKNPRKYQITIGISLNESAVDSPSMIEIETIDANGVKGQVSFPLLLLPHSLLRMFSVTEDEIGISPSTWKEVPRAGQKHFRYDFPDVGDDSAGTVRISDKESYLDENRDMTTLFTHEYKDHPDVRAKIMVDVESSIVAMLLNRFYVNEECLAKSGIGGNDDVDQRNGLKVTEFPKYTVPTPVSRLIKGYGNQEKYGTSHVDLIDSISGYTVAEKIYEPYADQILAAVEHAKIRKLI